MGRGEAALHAGFVLRVPLAPTLRGGPVAPVSQMWKPRPRAARARPVRRPAFGGSRGAKGGAEQQGVLGRRGDCRGRTRRRGPGPGRRCPASAPPAAAEPPRRPRPSRGTAALTAHVSAPPSASSSLLPFGFVCVRGPGESFSNRDNQHSISRTAALKVKCKAMVFICRSLSLSLNMHLFKEALAESKQLITYGFMEPARAGVISFHTWRSRVLSL